MTIRDVLRHRLHHQQLVKPTFDKAGEVVSYMGAVQAQDYFGSFWTIAQRMKNVVIERDVEQAVIDRSIVRTWPMRGTLHFVDPKDVRWMLKYLTPRVISRTAGLYKQAGLDKKIFDKSKRLWVKALEGGNQLTRDEMYDVLEKAKISTANTRGLFILGYVAQQGLICFGARKGKQQTFALLDEWLPSHPMLKKDEALGELAHRYFTSHGPAILEDFMWWAGLTKADALNAVSSIKNKLIEEAIEGQTYWFSDSGESGKVNPATAYLLPTYDEFGIAYKDRSPIITPEDHKKIGGLFTSGIMINGKIVGVWRRTINKDIVTIETKHLHPFSAAQKKSIVSAAKRYSKFLELSLKMKTM